MGAKAAGRRFTALDMVKAVDPFFEIYWDALKGIPKSETILGQHDIYTILGRFSLVSMTRSLRCSDLLSPLAKQIYDRTTLAFTSEGFVGLPPLGSLEVKEEKKPPQKATAAASKKKTRSPFQVV